jgi:GT2 family glycosyltransferase
VIDNSTGKYIVWVDGDMLLSGDYVRRLVEFMEEHPEIGIAKGRYSLKSGSNLLGTIEAYSRAVGKMVDYSSEKAQSKVLGTAGCIYRTETAKQVRGFDESMTGYGEDWDMEIRIRKAGWVFNTVNVYYSDHERCGVTWKNLWKRYWLRGYYSHFFLHKHRGLIELYKMLPPMGFLAGVFDSRKLFRLTGNATVFFLPVQNMSKMIAWDVGFLESHLNSYQPR